MLASIATDEEKGTPRYWQVSRNDHITSNMAVDVPSQLQWCCRTHTSSPPLPDTPSASAPQHEENQAKTRTTRSEQTVTKES